MRLRWVAPVLFVIAVIAGAFAVTQIESLRDGMLVLAVGLALAAVTGALALTTERRRRAMRETERFFALSPEMVICAGFDGYWKRLNHAVEVVLGYTEAEALGLPFMELIHPDDRERSEDEAARVMAGATALAFENRMLCKDGTYKWIEWTATPVPEERVMYTIGRDVTERRRSESEEIALRRLATLIAEGLPAAEIFSAVSEEVGRLFDSDLTVVARFDRDGPATVVMGVAKEVTGMPVGSRWELEDGLAAARVYRTGRSARIDAVDRSALSTPIGEVGRRLGVVSTVSCPIHVEGRLWGTITVPAKEPLPPDTEERLEKFTQVVATAIANADAREAVARLADEQAALRRVATLVARGITPEEVFEAVAAEVSVLFGSNTGAIVRFEDDRTVTVLGAVTGPHEVGKRVTLDPGSAVDVVRETSRSARFDTDDPWAPEMPSLVQEMGIRSAVASPIVVQGELWGALTTASLDGPLPRGAERRLTEFTELVATAVANTQAREEVTMLADEQAALRRVAELVAQQPSPSEAFTAVTQAVGPLLDADLAVLHVFPGDGTATMIAGWSGDGGVPPIGTRVPLDGDNLAARIFESGAPARIDSYAEVGEGEATDLARSFRLRSAVGAPILVEGKLWGALMAATRGVEPWAENAETRIAQFTELVATAIANAEARAEVERLADEQATLRRIATLVAQGLRPEEIFAAVIEETAATFRAITCVERFEHDPSGVILVGVSEETELPVGMRWELAEGLASATVYRTGRSARLGADYDWSSRGGPVAEEVRRLGIVSQVSCPISVEGSLWGVITLNAREELPPDTEQRLEKFTDLVTTAIANAESREGRGRLTDEQAALRRVATLVAQGAAPEDLFEAVAEEVGRLLPVVSATMGRYEPDDSVTTVASWSTTEAAFPTGRRWPTEGTNVAWVVLQTGRSARIDDFSAATDPIGVAALEAGYKSAVGSPIVVEGHLWGVMTATSAEGPMPPGSEARLASFTELVATAIANANSREALARLADEQAALRRVATLVAEGAPTQDVLRAVVEEVGHLLPFTSAAVGRFEPDDMVTTVAAWSSSGEVAFPADKKWPTEGKNVTGIIHRTGRPARLDDFSDASGPIGVKAREAGYRSVVGSPITVDGRLWGVMTAASTAEDPLPADTEGRLASFTELLATLFSKLESREAVERLAEEQAALQRVATLVAKEAPPSEVFAKVAEEAGSLLGNADCAMVRDEGDGSANVVAAWGLAVSAGFPIGTRVPLDDDGVAASVLRDGRPCRIDDYSAVSAAVGRGARQHGIRSAVGCPIVVRGRTWGALIVATTGDEVCPPETERRLSQFADLVATAIGNASARAEVERLADEQAGLRRVATLVARGVPPVEVFWAVSDEVGRLFGTKLAAVGRFEPDGRAIALVGADRTHERWDLADFLAWAEVLRTGRSARADAARWESEEGETAERLRSLGIVSSVASPIVVEGELWGAMLVASTDEPLPPDTEARLEKFTGIVATAIANTESRAELAASRRRIVAASDEARRRMERDLHDGTQQRLVSLGLAVRAAEAAVPPDRSDLQAELSRIAAELVDATEDLQEFSRGIHPAILSEGGLGAALRTLARRSAIPVALDVATDERLPEPVEVAAYYVASEALANVTKHAQASRVDITVAASDGSLRLSIRDDGVGGADPRHGSGLIGLRDRVEALGGTMKLDSGAGSGTSLVVTLPLAVPVEAAPDAPLEVTLSADE